MKLEKALTSDGVRTIAQIIRYDQLEGARVMRLDQRATHSCDPFLATWQATIRVGNKEIVQCLPEQLFRHEYVQRFLPKSHYDAYKALDHSEYWRLRAKNLNDTTLYDQLRMIKKKRQKLTDKDVHVNLELAAKCGALWRMYADDPEVGDTFTGTLIDASEEYRSFYAMVAHGIPRDRVYGVSYTASALHGTGIPNLYEGLASDFAEFTSQHRLLLSSFFLDGTARLRQNGAQSKRKKQRLSPTYGQAQLGHVIYHMHKTPVFLLGLCVSTRAIPLKNVQRDNDKTNRQRNTEERGAEVEVELARAFAFAGYHVLEFGVLSNGSAGTVLHCYALAQRHAQPKPHDFERFYRQVDRSLLPAEANHLRDGPVGNYLPTTSDSLSSNDACSLAIPFEKVWIDFLSIVHSHYQSKRANEPEQLKAAIVALTKLSSTLYTRYETTRGVRFTVDAKDAQHVISLLVKERSAQNFNGEFRRALKIALRELNERYNYPKYATGTRRRFHHQMHAIANAQRPSDGYVTF